MTCHALKLGFVSGLADLRRSVGELESKQEATGQRVTELESKEKATDQRVTELEGKVETLSQQVQGNNDVASGNADNQPIPPDQPPIPMVPSGNRLIHMPNNVRRGDYGRKRFCRIPKET